MKFSKTILLVVLINCFILLITIPLLNSHLKASLFSLNINKNREQAERLATLVSIDLEKGVDPNSVLAKVQSMLENTPQSQEHFACIVEDENKVIAHPKPSNVGKDVTGWKLKNQFEEKTFTQAAGEGVPFGGIQTRTDGSQDISYQVPISTKPWAVCVHTKLSIVDQQASVMLQKFMVYLILILLSSQSLIVFFITRKTQRI